MTYTIYFAATGQILRVVQTEDIEIQLQTGEAYIEGLVNDSAYYIANGSAVAMPPKPNEYSVFDYSTKAWVADINIATGDALAKRQRLLVRSDWTQMPDVQLQNKTEWATYRQELRDITDQPGYPFNVVWPTPPTA
jgi:hypothetical protein